MNRRFAALLALLLPSRGRHSGPAGPAALEDPPLEEPLDEPVPATVGDEGVSPSDMTMFDMPPSRVRRYVNADSENGRP